MPWTLLRAFLAQGRAARLVTCVVVALAAVVWIALASVLLRVVFALVLLLLVAWCAWLVYGIWTGRKLDPDWRSMLPVVRRRFARPTPEPVTPRSEHSEDLERRERELAEREAAFAVLSSSLNAAIDDLLRGQERLHADAEQLQREVAGQTEAMNAVVAKLAHADTRAVPRAPEPTVVRDHDPEPDLRAVRLELESDLRLEEIEQQEERLRAFEEQLRRREHQLANFVAQTQSTLRPA